MPAPIANAPLPRASEAPRAQLRLRSTGPEFAHALRRVSHARGAREPTAPGGPRLVRSRRTQLSGSDAAQALSQAWKAVVGEAPSRETLSILTAQWAHETGRGRSMYNFNFGGIKGTGPSGLSVAMRTREGWGPTERRITDRFRAYETAAQGATDYVRLLTGRYRDAVAAAQQGDAPGFVRGLKAKGYFTGNEQAYTRSVAGLSELALGRGFDALGCELRAAGPSGLEPSGLRIRSAPLAASAAAQLDRPLVAALALVEEISRAAVRIALDSTQDAEKAK